MMKYVNSSNSISSLVSASNSAIGINDNSFEELVSKLFSCNIVLVLTDHAKLFVKNCFGTTTLATVLNQFASISNLHLTIRDLNGHSAYGLNKIRFRFFDIEQFKNRPNGAQLKKLHFDIVSSMANAYLSENDNEDSFNNETPWYDMWKNVFIDTFEPSDHEFIGTNCGCFFVISQAELPHYKTIFERLCTSVKQNSTLRFIQSDFVRYFIILSNRILEPLSATSDEFTKTCHNLKLDFPNSFVFYIDGNSVSNANLRNNTGDSTFHEESNAERTNQINAENSMIISSDTPLDPLSVASTESRPENSSKFYQELQSQRQQNQQNNSTTSSTIQSRDIINDWLSHLSIHDDHLKEIMDSLSETIDFMLREFISKSLVPWAEKQIKTLGEIIADQRRGFRKSLVNVTKIFLSNMSSTTGSLSKTLTGTSGTSSGVIYIPDAQEMQQRKLADICMIFSIYEMAHSLYYTARKDFQSEQAWIYYAGAAEMSDISSYFLNNGKGDLRHIDKAISKYLDPCRSVNLATRATILASEWLCKFKRYEEAANLYIRMTGDDSDLRSALFLEQASKCYLAVSPKLSLKASPSQVLLNAIENSFSEERVSGFKSRYRKSAFHSILAGHRYNRCGLKQFALFCYRRYNYPNWEAASDHVNMTVAKLYLAIAGSNSKKEIEYRQKGLEIFRKFSHKKQFFDELIRELKKNQDPTSNTVQCPDLHILNIPMIDKVELSSPDSIQINDLGLAFVKKPNRVTCYLGEQVDVVITLSSPFEVTLSDIRLVADNPENVDSITNPQSITLKPDEQVAICLKFVPVNESDFTFTGLDFKIDGLCFKRHFPRNIRTLLGFLAVRTLPLITFDVQITELELYSSQCPADPQQPNKIFVPKSVYGSEMLDLKILFRTLASEKDFQSIQLTTNVRNFYHWNKNDSEKEENFSAQYTITDLSKPLELSMQVPVTGTEHTASFRLTYSQNGQVRNVWRDLQFQIAPCINIDLLHGGQVITFHNLSANESLAVYDCFIGDSVADQPTVILVPASFSAHLLPQSSSIAWAIQDKNVLGKNVRQGKIHLRLDI